MNIMKKIGLVTIGMIVNISCYATPYVLTWDGVFGAGTMFDGADVSGQAWVVQQRGDTGATDLAEPPNVLPAEAPGAGFFNGLKTTLDIAALDLFGMESDTTSGFVTIANFGVIQLTDNSATYCYFCGLGPVGLDGIDVNVLNNDFTLALNGEAHFGFWPDSPLTTFEGGTHGFGGFYTGSLLSVTGRVSTPATLALFGLGFAGLGWFSRKRV